jgi:MFS transporter, Spinster family, sphingosine-1-phosphate transporter
VIKSRQGILALLTGLNLFNYLDRMIVVAVSPKIQKELNFGDAEIGWVISVFMFGYFLTSPIFGWLGDRFPRKGLIAVGVLVWSVATAMSGLAGSLASMLVARVAVGVGEASYATLSPTIIDDIAPPAAKNRWLAIFYVAIPVGSALGFLFGGFVEARYGWRTAFFVGGGPGIVLALLTLLIEEPKRAVITETKGGSRAYLELARTPPYVATVAGYIAQTFALGGFVAWAPHFLYRKLCLDLETANFIFGGVTCATGLLGTAIGGFISDRLPGDRTRACLKVCAWSSAVAAPLALLTLFMPSPTPYFVALGLCELALFISVSPTNAALLISVPASLRATGMAVSIFAIHLLGDLISPPVIGAVSDAFGDKADRCAGASGLQTGMYILPAAVVLAAIFWWRGAYAQSSSSAARPIAARR